MVYTVTFLITLVNYLRRCCSGQTYWHHLFHLKPTNWNNQQPINNDHRIIGCLLQHSMVVYLLAKGLTLMLIAGNPYRRGRISTVDLLALTKSFQLLFIYMNIYFLFYKTTYLDVEVNCTEPSLQ